MKLYVLQLWDFRAGSAVQTAYLRLKDAQDAVRDFSHFGSNLKPVRVRTYEIKDPREALVSLMEWGAGDVVPTLPEDWLSYEREFK